MKYVTMTDTFFSGWGPATNKINALTIACETTAQAEQIAAHARSRPEMKRVKIVNAAPTDNHRRMVTNKTYADDIGGVWIAKGGRL